MGCVTCLEPRNSKSPKIERQNTDFDTKEMVFPGKKDIRILSIDGGGIRGLLPATILREISRRTNKHPSELFDLVAGTSIGGIVALALTAPKPDKTPKYTMDDIVEILSQNGDKIFSQSLGQSISCVGGLSDEKYKAEGLEGVLEKYFGDQKLSETLVPVMVTSFELGRYTPFCFCSWDTKNDFKRKFAGRATSAAPTYFELAKGNNMEGVDFACVDGGCIMNNPSIAAFAEARKIFPDAQTFTIVSIGTGKLSVKIDVEAAKDWGELSWIRPLINLMMDGTAKGAHQQMKQLFSGSYIRLNPRLSDDMKDMDNVSKENIGNLIKCAEEYVKSGTKKMDKVVEILNSARK